MGGNYWQRLALRRMGRRRLLRNVVVGGAGLATVAAIGCGNNREGTSGGSGSAAARGGGQIRPSGKYQEIIEHFPLQYPAEGNPRQGGTMLVASPYDLAGLDPTKSQAGGVIQHVNIAYNRLVKFKTGPEYDPLAFPGEIVPDLAAEWELPDERTFVFTLNPQVKWQNLPPLNGRPFVAQDVVYAYQQYKAGGPSAFYMRFVESVDAVDDRTVRVRLTEPFADQLAYFASRYLPIFPKELAERGELATKAVGTGPMVLKEARKGERMVWERNPDYFEGPVPLDGVTFQIISDEPTRVQLIRAGQADVAVTTFTNIESIEQLLSTNPDIAGTRAAPISGRINWAFQLRKAPWQDVRMRRGVSLALDLQKWGNLVYGEGLWYTGPNIPWPNVLDEEPSFEDLGQWYQYDPSEAKKLIQAAGGEGIEVEVFYYPYRTDYDDFADLAVEDLRAVGLTPKVQKVDYTTFNSQWIPGEYNSVAFGWKAIPVAPDDIFSGYYRSDSPLNRWGIKDPELDRLVDQQRRSTDPEERRQVWKRIWDMDLDQVWYVNLPDTIQFNVMQPWVQGLRFGWIQTNVTDAYDIGQQLSHVWLNPRS